MEDGYIDRPPQWRLHHIDGPFGGGRFIQDTATNKHIATIPDRDGSSANAELIVNAPELFNELVLAMRAMENVAALYTGPGAGSMTGSIECIKKVLARIKEWK